MNFVREELKIVKSYRITACECEHLVRRGHFRSRDKDGAHHLIRQSLKPHAALKPHGFMFYRSYCRSKFYIAGIGIFDVFAPVTLTLTI